MCAYEKRCILNFVFKCVCARAARTLHGERMNVRVFLFASFTEV